MGRHLRFVPPGGSVVEVTSRTIHGRHLLKPSRKLNRIILGVLGRAQRKYPVGIHGYAFLSNHYHMLLWVKDACRLAEFMTYFNGNLAREAGRLHRWHQKFWAGRYHDVVVSDEPEAQIGRLKYILAQGVKEGLVSDPRRWPGVHCARALLGEEVPSGTWLDRTGLSASKQSGRRANESDFIETERPTITPLPCWDGLAPEDVQEQVADLVQQVIDEGRAKPHRSFNNSQSALKTQRLARRPPAPWFHCASRAARRQLVDAYRLFSAAYREAAARLRRGDPDVLFPPGCFPPAQPFTQTA